MTHPVIQRRLAERRAMIDTAATWAGVLTQRTEVVAVVVFGALPEPAAVAARIEGAVEGAYDSTEEDD